MTRLMVLFGFMIAFLAGAITGIIYQQGTPVTPSSTTQPSRESIIAQQLSLTPDQQKQMKEIWSSLSRRESWDRRIQLRRERDDAIARLISPEDRPAYDQIVADYKKRHDELEAEGQRAFTQAVEKTRAILTEEQRAKYEQLLARNPGRGQRGTTRPATQKEP